MANNYYAHRQFYINGMSDLGDDTIRQETLENNETGITAALRNISPILKYNGIKPIWIYSQNGEDIDDGTPHMLAFRNGDKVASMAAEYFDAKIQDPADPSRKITRNPMWRQKNAAVICITDWGYRPIDFSNEYEALVFSKNGFLLNNSFNSFFVSISGVLYGVLTNSCLWTGMRKKEGDHWIPVTDSAEYERCDEVNVVVIRKNNNLPYAALPYNGKTTGYDNHACTTEDTQDVIPSFFISCTPNSAWSWYSQDNYGVFITLGSDETEIDGLLDNLDFKPDQALYSEEIKSTLRSMLVGKMCFEIPNDNNEKYTVYDLSGRSSSSGFDRRVKFHVNTVEELGITIHVPYSDNEGADVGDYFFTIKTLPKGSQFWVSTRALQFSDEISIIAHKIDPKEEETRENTRYYCTSRAYPNGLGRPFFDENYGLAYIPLGKCYGNVEDYNQNEFDDSNEEIMGQIYNSPKDYSKIGGSNDGVHIFPLLTPKAEDVFVFVGNKYGMVKLTPYVDYTIEKPGEVISGNLPVILLRGRTEFEGLTFNGHYEELNAVQRTFPLPTCSPIEDDGSNYNQNDPNNAVFIRVFYGYPKNRISTYWGPNADMTQKREDHIVAPESDPVAEINCSPANFAINGYSIENTVFEANIDDDNRFRDDNDKLLSTATMVPEEIDNRGNRSYESIPWSVLPRDSFLEFNAGKYTPMETPYLSRIVLDRTFNLETDGKYRDVELHALVDEKYGIAEVFRDHLASGDPSYFDEILNTIGVSADDEDGSKNKWVNKNKRIAKQSDENNDPAFFYLLNNGNQIHESINIESWLTWFTNINDATDEVFTNE